MKRGKSRLEEELKLAKKRVDSLKQEVLYKTISNEKLENQIEELKKNLGMQFEIVSKIGSSPDLARTTGNILRQVRKKMRLDEIAILLFEPNDGRLRHFASYGLSKKKTRATFAPGDGISGIVFQTKKRCLIERVGRDPRFKRWEVDTEDYLDKAFLSIPLKEEKRIIGVVNASAQHISVDYANSLTVLAKTIAPMISLQQMKKHQEDAYFETIRRIMDFTEALNPYTFGHSYRVYQYSLHIADKLKCSPRERDLLGRGSRLHDVGKIAIMDIVKKPGLLSKSELKIMREHPLLGEQFVRGFEFLKDTVPIIKHHHERPSGKGYPWGLEGSKIPRLVSIVSIADAFDAMTSDRPYRERSSLDYAISELKKYRGYQFNEGIVEAFIENYHELEILLKDVKRKSKATDLNDSGFTS
ncbi:MAG: HD domain-containing protein [Deltaproteobacteria bacterium]|nr:MAG: HD domain-containing protein [Deltaproteobacteria bacterium]